MFITTTTAKGSDDVTYRLHRDSCARKNGTERTLEEQNANDPQITLDALPCSKCKPSPAVLVSVRDEAQKALHAKSKAKAPKAAKPEPSTSQEPVQADTEGDSPVTIGRGRTLASKDGEKECTACHETKAITKFPTLPAKNGEVPERGDECRDCRNAARAAKKAAKG